MFHFPLPLGARETCVDHFVEPEVIPCRHLQNSRLGIVTGHEMAGKSPTRTLLMFPPQKWRMALDPPFS